MSYEKESIKIIIENPYDGQMKIDKDQIITTKEEKNHGFGIKSIKTVAAKYGGYINIKNKDNWFVISVIIPENQP